MAGFNEVQLERGDKKVLEVLEKGRIIDRIIDHFASVKSQKVQLELFNDSKYNFSIEI